MGDWYRKYPNNCQVKGHKEKKTLTKIEIEAALLKELQVRIAKGELSTLGLKELVQFAEGRMPKESIGTVDHNINYITNTPRPQVIDITPKHNSSNALDIDTSSCSTVEHD